MMIKPFYRTCLSLVVILITLVSFTYAQDIPYHIANNAWNPDSLGNHRAVVKVTSQGKVAAVIIPWRVRQMNTDQQTVVVDAATNKLIHNVECTTLNREQGTVYFEPTSGEGIYYVYYLPYQLKKPVNYPNAVYKKMVNKPDSAWEMQVYSKNKPAPVSVLYFEAINALNSFYPMEVIATENEMAKLINQNSDKPYMVFPESRMFPIKMDTDLPLRWIEKGSSLTFADTAARGENFSFQLGIYAHAKNMNNVRLHFSDLTNSRGNKISANTMSCLNTDGTNWNNTVLKKIVDIPQGHVQALWCLVNMPINAIPATYNGTVTITANGEKPVAVQVKLVVNQNVLKDGGVNKPWKQTRLTWLNSTLAQNNSIIKPYIPLKVENNSISLLGRKITLANNGLPAQISTFFTEEMTGIGSKANNELSAPFSFITKSTNGAALNWHNGQLQIQQREAGKVNWSSTSTSEALRMKVTGAMEFDGFINYQVKVTALRDVNLGDIQMQVPFNNSMAEYMMGLNQKGGKMPDAYQWQWDVAHKNQDGAWIGTVNAGLQFSLRDEKYVRPLNTNFYLDKPLVLPASWGNDGKGGINITHEGKTVLVTNYSGARIMKKGDVLYYNFTLIITPFHTIDTEQQWATRFYHKYNNLDTIKATGATVVNIHHGTAINPYINYPFIAHDAMKSYIDSAHRLGLKVKIYNTVRELSNSAYEIAPLRSLGHEVYSTGKGGGYSWLQEHLGQDYIAAWYVPEVKDAAIVNSGMSRWHNYYVEGMNWLVNNVGIDGIYLDDVAFDRTTMKRIKRILTQNGHPGIIDLHSANQYNKRDGFNNSANLYLEHFPYLNRLWFGEYFDYEKNGPDFFMTEVSGIPFGLMGEMLQGGGNPWRGMIYGMTNRMPWSDNADPRPIWKAWDDFGIKGSRMIGYWVKNNPVKTSDKDVLATVYLKHKNAMVAIASWAAGEQNVKLTIDWKALGIDAAKATLVAPEIKNFQPGKIFAIGDEISVPPGKGWLLILN